MAVDVVLFHKMRLRSIVVSEGFGVYSQWECSLDIETYLLGYGSVELKVHQPLNSTDEYYVCLFKSNEAGKRYKLVEDVDER